MTAVKTVNPGKKKEKERNLHSQQQQASSGSAPEVRRLNGQNPEKVAEGCKDLLMFAA